MSEIWGEHSCTIDDKYRIVFPAKVRESFEGVVLTVTKGLEDCLVVYTKDTFEAEMEKLMNSDSFKKSPQRNNILRRLRSPAVDVEIDKTGRIKLPSLSAAQMGLKKDCVLVGMGNRAEIWDADTHLGTQQGNQIDLRDSMNDILGAEGLDL